jgi:hypothetical protein
MVWYIDREEPPEYVQQHSAWLMRDLFLVSNDMQGLGVPYDERTPEQKLAWQRQADPHYERIEARPGGRKPKPYRGQLRHR